MRLSLSAAVAAFATVLAAADDPSFAFAARGLYLPSSREASFVYESAGVSNLEATLSKCHVNNLNAYRLDSSEMKLRMTKLATKRLELAPPYAEKSARKLNLTDVAPALKPGVYRLEVDTGLRVKTGPFWWSSRHAVGDDCLFAVTDLGVAVVASPSADDPRAVVLVHSFKDGAPVANATVQILTRANQLAAEGKTDRVGRAELRFVPSFKPEEDALSGVLVRKDGDLSYLQFSYANSAAQRDDGGQAEFQDARAFLFAERDICRPGEAFDTALFLRSSPQGGMKALGNAPVDLELWDADDDRVETRRIATDRWGFASARWELPRAARVGGWSVVAKLAGRELGKFPVQVAAFVPDRFRVGLRAAGRPLAFAGEARYYFGEDVTEGDWKLAVSAAPAPAAAQWAGWTVGTGEIPDFPTWTAKGAIGKGTFSATLPDDCLDRLMKSASPVLLTAEASVTPPGARTVSTATTVRLDPTDRYIGIREGTVPRTDVRTFDLTFLPAGKGASVALAPTDEIAVRVIRREWKCHLVEKRGTYSREWREERTELKELARTVKPGLSASVATLAYPVSALASGQYELVAVSGALETRFAFWHWAGEISERSVSPAALPLRVHVEKAKPWSKVTLSFKAARAGRAYVVSGERGIEYSDTFEVKAGVNRFDVPVRGDAASAFTYVAVTVMNGSAPEARRIFGLARIPVDHAARRYPLALTVPEVVRPGADLEVRVKADGAGAVRLMAVDEGVLALTGYATPDIFGYLYDHDFGCPFDENDVYSQIYPDLKILPNGKIGGGAAGGAIRRKNVRTRRDSTVRQRETARVIAPLVELPASGEATVRLKMPDFTGSMRLMAVAADETRAGSAEATVIVRDAASVFVNAPRAAVGGDRFRLVAEVFNHDLPESDWSLVLDGRVLSGHLAKGASTNVAVDVKLPAQAFGTLRFAGTLKIGGETFRDAVYTTVRPKHPPVTRVSYELRRSDAPALADQIPATEAWERLDEDLTETCSAPLTALRTALKWLDGYPYGCLEQTTAAAFPFLAADDLMKLGLTDAVTVSNATAKVKAASGEILQMATDDGAFAMWPGEEDTWVDGSLFALHFLFAAESHGLLKPEPRKKLLAWLRNQADGNDPRTRLRRAYAAYVLALARHASFAEGAKNILSDGKSDFAAFLAAAALVRGGHRADGEVAFRKALADCVWETSEVPASVCWSRVRLRGMTLAIVTQTLPNELTDELVGRLAPLVVKLVESLRSDSSAWGTTRDNAWATLGLASFLARTPSEIQFVSRIRTGIPKVRPARPTALTVVRKLPARVRKGDLVTVELELRSTRDIAQAVLCDLVPGGFEPEDGTLRTRSGEKAKNPGRSEIRDDRWLWFGSIDKTGRDNKPIVLRYNLRAVIPGTFAVPAVSVEDMYDPDVAGLQDAAATVVVE